MNKLEGLIEQVETDIRDKRENNQMQPIDESVLSYISVYQNGTKLASTIAAQWLKLFFVNAGYVKNLKVFKGKN